MDNRNILICSGYLYFNMKEKFDWIRENICSKHEKVLFLKTGSSWEEIRRWESLNCIPKNLHVIPPESSMILESFALGHKDENGLWISEYNWDYDALVIDHVQSFGMQLPNMREEYWRVKPFYIISDQSRSRIIDCRYYYTEYKFDEIIEVGERK